MKVTLNADCLCAEGDKVSIKEVQGVLNPLDALSEGQLLRVIELIGKLQRQRRVAEMMRPAQEYFED